MRMIIVRVGLGRVAVRGLAKEKILSKQKLFTVFLVGMVIALPVFAGPADYVYTPTIERGELELDVKYGVASSSAGTRPQAGSIGLGYGVTEHWFTEAYLTQKQDALGRSDYVEWENRFLLLSAAEFPFDVGFITEIEMPITQGASRELRVGTLFQGHIEKWQWNSNVIFERVFSGTDEYGVAQAVNLGYQWQVHYPLAQAFQWGVQGFGEVGKWNEWYKSNAQNHRMGPAVFGKLRLSETDAIKYNATCLFGLTSASPNATLRMQLEYEL